MVRLLGTHGEDLIEDEDYLGNKPLHLAATEGHSEVVEVLLKLGAAVDGRWVYYYSRNKLPWTLCTLCTFCRRQQPGEETLLPALKETVQCSMLSQLLIRVTTGTLEFTGYIPVCWDLCKPPPTEHSIPD